MGIIRISSIENIGVKAFKPLKKIISPSEIKYEPILETSKPLSENIIKTSLKISKGLSFDQILDNIKLVNGKYNSKTFEYTKKLEQTGLYNHDIISILSNKENLDPSKFDSDAFKTLIQRTYEHFGLRAQQKIINQAIGKNGEFSVQDLKDFSKIFDKYEKEKDILTAINFREYSKISSIDELSIPEKNKFLTKLVSNGFNERVSQDIQVLPKSKEEYEKLVQKLLDNTSLKVKPLGKAEQNTALSALKNLFNFNGEISENNLQQILKIFPEIATKDGTISKSSLKILQKMNKDGRFAELTSEDKLTLQLAALFKDSSSIHGVKDIEQSAYNAYYLAEKLNLPHEDKLKLYSIIKNQNLFEKAVNGSISENAFIKSACELRYNNNYNMLEIFSDAKGITSQENQELLQTIKNSLQKEIKLIQRSAIQVPQSKTPKASQFIVNGDSVKKVKSNGVTNIVVYLDKKTPVKYIDENGVEKILNTQDVHNFYHATTHPEGVELSSRPNSKYAISTSYSNPTQRSHQLFGTEGVIVNMNSNDIYYSHIYRDSDGTGFEKLLNLKLYRSRNIDQNFHQLSDIYKKYGCKSLEELRITNPQAAEELNAAILNTVPTSQYGETIGAFSQPQGVFFQGPKKGYNPMYASFFKDSTSKSEKLKAKIRKFFGIKESYKFKEVPQNLKQYAEKNDFAIFHLGN